MRVSTPVVGIVGPGLGVDDLTEVDDVSSRSLRRSSRLVIGADEDEYSIAYVG